MFRQSCPRILQTVCWPLERQEKQIWGNFLSSFVLSWCLFVFQQALNERWIFLAYRQPGPLQMHHTPSRCPLSKRSSAVQIKLTPIPDPTRPTPPHLLSALFSRPSLSELFFLCWCHVAERGSRHPSDHPHTRRHPLSLHGNPHLWSSLDRAVCKWGLDGEGKDDGSGRRGGLVVQILSKSVLR